MTGEGLARDVHRCEAVRVTSERQRGSDAGGEARNGGGLRPISGVTGE